LKFALFFSCFEFLNRSNQCLMRQNCEFSSKNFWKIRDVEDFFS
jgi:hypothetical protein